MFKNVTICFIFFLIFNLRAYSQKDFEHQYIGKESGRVLILNSDNSFLLLNQKNIRILQLDTLSYGTWHRDKGFIILNTPDSLNKHELKIGVIEGLNQNTDSVFIQINNPYEDHLSKHGGIRYINYKLSLDSYSRNFGLGITMDGNYVAFFKEKDDKLVHLRLTIIPHCYFYPSLPKIQYLVSEEYTFKNRDANIITIKIPQLTYDYFGLERFRNEYIKIKKGNLIFRGEVFKYKRQ